MLSRKNRDNTFNACNEDMSPQELGKDLLVPVRQQKSNTLVCNHYQMEDARKNPHAIIGPTHTSKVDAHGRDTCVCKHTDEAGEEKNTVKEQLP